MIGKPCRVCARVFLVRPAEADRRATCSMGCRRTWNAWRMKGRVPVAATAARKQAAWERLAVEARTHFGAISDRDVAIIRWAMGRAYQRGYKRGAWQLDQPRTAA